MINRIALASIPLVLLLGLGASRPAFASASILGFSVGEENITLSAILSQAIQQVKFLSDLAAISRAMKDNIAFIKDVYGTADDVINGRWDELTRDFLVTLVNTDPSLREIYSNTAAIVQDRVPRGNGFRSLLGAGLGDFMYHAFGPYPFGDSGAVHAYTDYRALSINKLIEDQQAALSIEHRAMERSWRECQQNPANCTRSQAELQTQTAKILSDLRLTENQRAALEAHRAMVESGEKRQRQVGIQQDLSQIADSFRTLRGQSAGAGAPSW